MKEQQWTNEFATAPVREGELRRARAAGVPANRIIFAGVGKTRREMAYALGARMFERHVGLETREVAVDGGDHQVLRGEAVAETDGREGLKSLEVLIAAYLSARDGKRVALPLDY